MIKYVCRIDPFWIEDLNKFKFVEETPIAPRDNYHKNFMSPQIMLKQSFNESVPNYKKFYDVLQVEEGSVCWLCLEPREMIPIHQDYFYTLKTKKNVDVDKCVRYLIMLEDWQLGHAVQFESNVLTKWSAGDVWVFDYLEKHCAANCGTTNFYSCQVSTLKITD